jgi:uncharacterized protein YecT (DUF1311 family)
MDAHDLRTISFLAPLLAITVSAKAESTEIDCSSAFSTPDIERCAAIELDAVEVSLNQAYRRLVKQLTKPDTAQDNYSDYRNKLLNAQRAWIKFREADCDTQYAMHRSGTIRNAVYLNCKQQRAEQRIKELNNYAPY